MKHLTLILISILIAGTIIFSFKSCEKTPIDNTNFAVLKGGNKFECPECGSVHVELIRTDTTTAGTFKRLMGCKSCDKNYFINNKTYQDYLVGRMMNG